MNQRNSIKRLVLVVVCMIFLNHLHGQELSISNLKETYQVLADTSFVKTVNIKVRAQEAAYQFPIIYDTELETVTDIQVYEKKGRRYKVTQPSIREEEIKLEYITSKKLKSILIPSETEVNIKYKVKCDELMYFASLPLFSNHAIDTLSYDIEVPGSFEFVYNMIHTDSLAFLTIDTLQLDGAKRFLIKTKPKNLEPDLMSLFGIYRNMKSPLMRTIVLPTDYKGQERKYMNDWYLTNLEDTRGLNHLVKNKIDKLTEGLSDPIEIIDVLYGYVRSNYKYVAIEVGMGAFIPTPINEVYKNKQGDCKDLSNFISQALEYKGIETRLALAATHSHITDCDFPSLSSANHVICMAYVNNEVIPIDPTDPIHQLRTPVQSLQNRTLLVVEPKGGDFYKMEAFSPVENLIQYDIDLDVASDMQELSGTFKVVYNGISGNFLRWTYLNSDQEEMNKSGLKHYESVFDQEHVSGLSIVKEPEAISTSGEIKVAGKIFKDGDKRLLFIDFIPPLFENEHRGKLLQGTFVGAPFKKEVHLRIRLTEPIEDFKEVDRSITEEGVSFKLHVSNTSEYVVEYTYEFLFDALFIDENNEKITSQVLNTFNKVINEPIVYKKKNI